MIDYLIAIPSYDRVKSLGRNTLSMLEENNIPKDKIEIYVVEEQYEDYKNMYPDYKIVKGVKGVVNQKNFILLENQNKNIVFIDDDIKHIYKKKGNGQEIYTNLEEVIEKGFNTCNIEETKIWGLYPACSGYYMKHNITTNLKFIIGCLFGVINNENSIMDWEHDNGEDSARTLHYYDLYKSVVRINDICPKTDYLKNKGGLQSLYTKEEREKDTAEKFNLLKQKYPQYCKVYTKKNGKVNIKIHHYVSPQ